MFNKFNFLLMIFPTLSKFYLQINLPWPSIFITKLRLEIRLVFIVWPAAVVGVNMVHQSELPIKHYISEVTT